MGLVFNYGKVGDVPTICGTSYHRTSQNHTLAEDNLPKIGTRATQLCAIALETSKRIAPENPRHQIAEQSTYEKAQLANQGQSGMGVNLWKYQSCQTARISPPCMQISEHIFETSDSKSGDAEADKKWVLQRLEEDWKTFDESATSGIETGGGGIIVTTGVSSRW